MGWRNPDELSEFEVHAEAFLNLKKCYRNVRGEYHLKKNGKRAARFDIVILDDAKNILLVIEVKAKKSKHEQAQYQRYGDLTGKPVLYLRGPNQCREAIAVVKGFLAATNLGDNYLPKIIEGELHG